MSALFTAAVATPGRAENPGQQAEGGAETSGLILKNFETGAAISVPRHFASASDMHEIRRRIHRQDVQARWTPSPENISVNLSTLRYSLPSYPPLAFMVNERDWRSILAFTVIGALALAAFSQASFYFPCTTGTCLVPAPRVVHARRFHYCSTRPCRVDGQARFRNAALIVQQDKVRQPYITHMQ